MIKNLSNFLAAFVLSVIMVCHAQAQASRNADSIKKQLDRLLVSKETADRQVLSERLKVLAASTDETVMSIAGSYYFQLKNPKAADSVFAAEIKKFPKGVEARIRTQQAISNIKRLPEMEKAYNEFIKNFPPDMYPKLPFGEDRLPYDRLRTNLAVGYVRENNKTKAIYYAGLLDADFWKVKSYGDIANAFYLSGDLTHAALYQKKAVESAEPFAGMKQGNSAAANFAAKSYADACRVFAQILHEQKQDNDALKYIELAVKAAKNPGPEFDFAQAQILAALNRNYEAYDRIEVAVRSGEATQEMADLFKVLYVKLKANSAGLDAYQADIQRGVKENLHKRLIKNMLNEPAADFTLTDLKGNKVSLADLKGKIVILDFWATWCGPCKASFPAMQLAVDKYKNDPDVKFLFIHTWERTATAVADARAYIAGMKYDFEVLMDTKDPETKANKVVDSYKVSSIPAKFIIDGKGNIRFKLTGFNGSNEAAVDEITMMISMAQAKN